MNDEAAFLRAIAEDPENDTPRLVFADWLQEREDPRSDWVRDKRIWGWMAPNAINPIPNLIEALADGDYHLRESAQKGLALLGNAGVDALIKLLESDDERADRNIGEAFAAFDSEVLLSALPQLSTLVRDGRGMARIAAIRGCSQIGVKASSIIPELRAIVQASEQAHVGDRLANAAEALGHLGATALEAVPDLVRTWQSWDDGCETTGSVLHALGPDAAEYVLEGLADVADPDFIFLEILNEYGETIVPVLREGCQHAHPTVRATAALTLASSDSAVSLPTLLQILKEEDRPPYHIGCYLGVFRKLGDVAQEAVPLLRQIAPKQHSVGDQVLIANFLQHFGDIEEILDHVVREMSQSDVKTRVDAIWACEYIEPFPEKFREPILNALEAEDLTVKQEALRVLQKVITSDDGDAISLIQKRAREDTNVDIRQRALWTLRGIYKSMVDPVLQEYLHALRDSEETLRAEAVEALCRSGEFAALTQFLTQEPSEARQTELLRNALRFNFPATLDIVELLRVAMSDSHLDVRVAGTQRLQNFASQNGPIAEQARRALAGCEAVEPL